MSAEDPGELDDYGFTHYKDGSFYDDRGRYFRSDRTADDGSGDYFDKNWRFHKGQGRFKKFEDDYDDPLLRDFENAGDDEDDFVEDELYQEFLNQHGGKFGEEVKKHSYPATVVV
jgi:hypothetical protein